MGRHVAIAHGWLDLVGYEVEIGNGWVMRASGGSSGEKPPPGRLELPAHLG